MGIYSHFTDPQLTELRDKLVTSLTARLTAPMWETVRFAPQTDASFAAMSAQANKMIETLEGIDAAQRKLQQSAKDSDGALADMRMRLLEIDGTEEEIAAAKAERERNQIELELQRLQLELDRARVWKDTAKLNELEKEIGKQRELLGLLGQIEEKERQQRKKRADDRAKEEAEREREGCHGRGSPGWWCICCGRCARAHVRRAGG